MIDTFLYMSALSLRYWGWSKSIAAFRVSSSSCSLIWRWRTNEPIMPAAITPVTPSAMYLGTGDRFGAGAAGGGGGSYGRACGSVVSSGDTTIGASFEG